MSDPIEPPRPNRWRFVPRFSLRFILLATLLVGIGLATVGRDLYRASQRRAVAEQLLDAGAKIRYAHEKDGKAPAGPAWLAKGIGFDYFNPIEGVEFAHRAPLKEEEWSQLAKISTLRSLSFICMSMRNDDLLPIKDFKQLTRLRLKGSTINDEGLAPLAGLEKLESLELEFSQVRGPGLKHLPHLQSLYVRQTNLDLASIAQLTELKHLSLRGCELDPRQFSALAKLPLRELDLQYLELKDRDIDHLTQWKSLERLKIFKTDITAQGMAKLKAIYGDALMIPVTDEVEVSATHPRRLLDHASR